MRAVFVFFIVCFSLGLFASEPDSVLYRIRPYIEQDQNIDWLLQLHRETMERERGIPGFRVQIYMDSGNQARLRTQRARAEFEQKYPDTKAYITYDEPNFKLRVGDFRTRLDARRFLEEIASDYPSDQVYIVIDNINYPDLQ